MHTTPGQGCCKGDTNISLLLASRVGGGGVEWGQGVNLGYVHAGPKRVVGEKTNYKRVWCRQRIPWSYSIELDIQRASTGQKLGRLSINVTGGLYRDVVPGFKQGGSLAGNVAMGAGLVAAAFIPGGGLIAAAAMATAEAMKRKAAAALYFGKKTRQSNRVVS